MGGQIGRVHERGAVHDLPTRPPVRKLVAALAFVSCTNPLALGLSRAFEQSAGGRRCGLRGKCHINRARSNDDNVAIVGCRHARLIVYLARSHKR